MKDIALTDANQLGKLIREMKPVRITKALSNGNIAIIQIANPENVPLIAKFFRSKKARFWKWAGAVEAGIRVGMIVYRNAMKKTGPRKPSFGKQARRSKV